MKRKHAEAFALMRYAGGGTSRTVWNSRDGVTPYVIFHDDAEMAHVDFKVDQYAPQHIPYPGDLVFIDLTFGLAQKLADDFMAANWESMRQQPEYADIGRKEMRDRTARRYIRDAMSGAPYYLEATRELRHAVSNLQGYTRDNTDGDTRFGPARWWWDPDDPYYTCSHCGSVHPAALTELLTTPGVHYSGSDWKYGYPHKFYLDLPDNALWKGSPKKAMKFYTRHLTDLTDDELDPIAELILRFFGIGFYREGEKTVWRAAPNTQRWGEIP